MSMRRLNGEHARRRKMRATAQLVANMQATLLLEQTSDTARLAAPNSRHALLGMTRIESAKRKNLVRPMKRGRQRKAGAVAQAIRDSQRRTRLHNSFRCLPHGIVRRNAFYVSRTAFFTLTGSRHEKKYLVDDPISSSRRNINETAETIKTLVCGSHTTSERRKFRCCCKSSRPIIIICKASVTLSS